MPKKGRRATRTTPGFTGPFKGAPQPGTLFDVRTIPKTGGEIGPRGYSLNRSRQFQKLFSEPETAETGMVRRGAPVFMGMKMKRDEDDPRYHARYFQGTSEEYGTAPAVRPEQHPFGPAHLGEIHNRPVEMGEYSQKEAQHPGYFSPTQERHKSMQRARSKMIDVLARSSVEPEHLHGLQRFEVQPPSETLAGSYHSEGGFGSHIHLHVTRESAEERMHEGETFHPPWVKQTKQRGPVDPQSEMTVLHEIGHHVSHQAGKEHAEYRFPQQQGREEAFADAYMLTHFRHDPRSERWAGRTDPREHTYHARGLEHSHFDTLAGRREYRTVLGEKNVLPRSTSLGRNLEESGRTERWQRPMLDEPHVEEGGTGQAVFTQVPKGFGSRWSDTGVEAEQADRAGIYQQRAIRTNIAKRRVLSPDPEIKRRWSISRTRNLGQQWDEAQRAQTGRKVPTRGRQGRPR